MKTIKFLVVVVLVISFTSCGNQGVPNKSLKTEMDSVSYALGVEVGSKIKNLFSDIDKDLYLQGFYNGLDSLNIKLSPKDISFVVANYLKKRGDEEKKYALKVRDKMYQGNKKLSSRFMTENKTKKGVITTESGLQYIVLKEGKGAKPNENSRVKVHYLGTLIDGTVFDSTLANKKPTERVVSKFVQGISEGLQLMSVGSKYRLFIPQELGYGVNPRRGVIKPYMALIFEVELLEIKK